MKSVLLKVDRITIGSHWFVFKSEHLVEKETNFTRNRKHTQSETTFNRKAIIHFSQLIDQLLTQISRTFSSLIFIK